MDALNDLISAGNVWDSAVNEAIMLIENEERRYRDRVPSTRLEGGLTGSMKHLLRTHKLAGAVVLAEGSPTVFSPHDADAVRQRETAARCTHRSRLPLPARRDVCPTISHPPCPDSARQATVAFIYHATVLTSIWNMETAHDISSELKSGQARYMEWILCSPRFSGKPYITSRRKPQEEQPSVRRNVVVPTYSLRCGLGCED